MSVLIICFSCVTAFADTSVSDDYNKTVNFFKTYIYNFVSEKETLKDLPDDKYLTLTEVFFDPSSSAKNPCVRTMFIPFRGKQIIYYGTVKSIYDISSITVPADTIYLYNVEEYGWFGFAFAGKAYYNFKTSTYGSTILATDTAFNSNGGNSNFTFGGSQLRYGNSFIFCSDENLTKAIVSKGKKPYYNLCDMNSAINYYINPLPNVALTNYCVPYSSLFSALTNIFPGYTGSVVDKTFDSLLSEKGLSCDNSILDKYKFQISYMKNNDIVMMFLNNNKKPDLKIDDYKDGLNYNSKKYTFTYNSSYDTVVYFPQYQKYLNYDDWYSSDSVPKDFRWFWSEDKKSFSLISDWNVSFDETGKASYKFKIQYG